MYFAAPSHCPHIDIEYDKPFGTMRRRLDTLAPRVKTTSCTNSALNFPSLPPGCPCATTKQVDACGYPHASSWPSSIYHAVNKTSLYAWELIVFIRRWRFSCPQCGGKPERYFAGKHVPFGGKFLVFWQARRESCASRWYLRHELTFDFPIDWSIDEAAINQFILLSPRSCPTVCEQSCP